MKVTQIYVINRSGSMIYDWIDNPSIPDVEHDCNYPLHYILEYINNKVTVIFGEKHGVQVRYWVSAINGNIVENGQFTISGKKIDVLSFLKNQQNYPVKIRFSPPVLSANDKISLTSMFYSLFAIAVQLSPVRNSSGILFLETDHFQLNCLQSRTGVKFLTVTTSKADISAETFLYRLYEIYADYALKDPFYTLDMPIRCQKFDSAIQQLLNSLENEKNVASTQGIFSYVNGFRAISVPHTISVLRERFLF